jgi:biotin carboxyl carrier protein
MKYIATVRDRQYVIEINREGRIVFEGETRAVDFKVLDDGALYSLLIDQESYEALVERRRGDYYVLMHGDLYSVHVADEREQRLARATFVPPSGDLSITAPMPGLIVEVPVREGQEVDEGDNLVVLESMKMGNELKAPRDGVVKHVHVKAGDSVDQDQTLVVLN